MRGARIIDEDRLGRSSEPYTAGRPGSSGRAVPILVLKNDGGFELDRNALRVILQRTSPAHDKPLVVVSVAGAYRKGKSFLLNFFLRYMRNKGRLDWMGDKYTPWEGFSWRHGCERDTKGILVWNELFLVTRSRGDQVAVLFMDTQGAFDSTTSVKDSATIFALSTLGSSVQVYNVSQNIQEDDLQYLQFFTEYGRMAQHESREKPFQKLVFLVRDWAHLSDAGYGFEGGRKLVKRRLKPIGQNEEQNRLRKCIKSCFQEIDGFLLPYPGRQVATGQSEEGYLPEMDNDFKTHVQMFVASVLAEDKLVTKRINGQEISFKDWVTYISKYAEIFQKKQLPELRSFLEVTADVNNIGTLYAARKIYKDSMEKICGSDKPFKNVWDLRRHHNAQLTAALKFFASVPKMGGEVYSRPYETRLKKEIEEMEKRFFENNKNKSFDATPLVLFAPVVALVGGAAAASLVGGTVVRAATSITGLLVGGTSLGTLSAWGVSRATGTMTAFREGVDSAADYTVNRIQRWFRTRPPVSVTSDTQQNPHSPKKCRDASVQQDEAGQPVQILRIRDDHSFELDEEALGRILLADHVKDKPVVVVSVAGAFRKGKSFLLDFFLRYMYSGCQDDWLDDPSHPLAEFSWRDVCERETTSILVWDKVFLVTTPQGRRLAVLFMYTQGSFDGDSTFRDCAKIFAFSTMTSSVQVYNLSRNIYDNDLQHLQFLNEYARIVQQDTGKEPFQELLLLVRDWNNQHDAGYGAKGGRDVFYRWLTTSEGQHKELQQLRSDIWSCFTNIGCFLMPHPGDKVATALSFDGNLSDVTADFKAQLQDLVPDLLAPDNLLVKKINGRDVSCQQLMNYFQVYANKFNKDKLPEPKSMIEMRGEDQPYLDTELLMPDHQQLLKSAKAAESARELFLSQCKPAGDEFPPHHLDCLIQGRYQANEGFDKPNKRTNAFSAARTPATLSAVVLAFYVVSNAFAMCGLHTFANSCHLLMGLFLISICLWGYVHCSGNMWDVGVHIDTIANVIWANLLEPLYSDAGPDPPA